MKAAVHTRYGPPDVVHTVEVERPVPKDNEILIATRAASVNPLDWHLVEGSPYPIRLGTGLFKPKDTRVGRDVAGIVEAVGSKVTQFKTGDEVFGVCRGSFAEYGCASEDKVAMKSRNVSFEDAASLPIAAITALQGLRDKGKIQQGQKVLIDGASGGVGTFAIQIAKSFGAEVTAVCSTGKMETARSIGADHVIDYTREDFTKNGQRYDLIFAANAHHSIFAYRHALGPKGIYIMAGGGIAQMIQGLILGPLLSKLGSKKLSFVGAKIVQKDLELLMELVASGKVVPVTNKLPAG